MASGSLSVWSTLPSSKKISPMASALGTQVLQPGLNRYRGALQGVLRATGQIGTEGTFTATCNNQFFLTPQQRSPRHRDDKEGRAHLGCACPALLLHTHCHSAGCAVGTGFVWITACSGHLQELHNLKKPVSPP